MRRCLPALLVSLALAAADSGPDLGPRRALAQARGMAWFAPLDGNLSREERDAFAWLLATAPLADLDAQAGPRLLEEARAALAARKATPWGPTVPEDLFRTWVLPPRVQDEPMDGFRRLRQAELLAQVAGKTAEEAVQELNLWALSKANFVGTDPRTASPEGVIRHGGGRCNELAGLLVAALRAVAIPARLAVVPVWAHQDGFHAWVEAWVDGRWRHLGASEIEPVLDRAWFDPLTPRAPRILSPAQGRPEPEDLTARYAPVRTLQIQVLGPNRRPAPGARVDLRLANEASLKVVRAGTADGSGRIRLDVGPGDFWVWARQGGRHGFRTAAAGSTEVTVTLTATGLPQQLDLTLAPAPARPEAPEQKPGPALGAAIKRADEARQQALAAFLDGPRAEALAQALKAPGAARALRAARGNAPAVEAFLQQVPDRLPEATALLMTLSEKDLREVTPELLLDHLPPAGSPLDPEVLRPRVAEEPLEPSRVWLRQQLPPEARGVGAQAVTKLAAWLASRVTLGPEESAPLSPRRVLELGQGDARGRDVCFVALCRSAGIPARLDPVTRQPVVRLEGAWHDVAYAPAQVTPRPLGGVVLQPAMGPWVRFGVELAVSRVEGDDLVPMALPSFMPLERLRGPLALPAGPYVLTTCQRDGAGRTHTRLTRFIVIAGQVTQVPAAFPPQPPVTRSR